MEVKRPKVQDRLYKSRALLLHKPCMVKTLRGTLKIPKHNYISTVTWKEVQRLVQ